MEQSLVFDRGPALAFTASGVSEPGVTAGEARADLEQVARNLTIAYPDADHGIGATFRPLKEQMVGDVKTLCFSFCLRPLALSFSSPALMSLAFCSPDPPAAVASSPFATALGASRGRVLRQLLTESLLLSVTASVIGLAVAVLGTHVL